MVKTQVLRGVHIVDAVTYHEDSTIGLEILCKEGMPKIEISPEEVDVYIVSSGSRVIVREEGDSLTAPLMHETPFSRRYMPERNRKK